MQERCSLILSPARRTCEDGTMTTPSRVEARVRQIATIKATSRRLIARDGAAGLSLREVSREMGLVSSALYRYFATRDELLTALIVDAYDDLGAAAERAAHRSRAKVPHDQLRAVARAVRRWATTNPNEYALLYGSPVPGYHAPEATIAPATRVTRVLADVVNGAWRGDGRSPGSIGPSRATSAMFEADVLEAMMPDVPHAVRARALMVWAEIYGFLTFELFGHFVGSVRHYGAFFDVVIDECAALVLPQ